MNKITIDLAPYGHECDACQNANYRRPGMSAPQYPCAIYALSIGAGYRQPSYVCPNCLGVLRILVGPPNQFRVLLDNAECVTRPVSQLVDLFEGKNI